MGCKIMIIEDEAIIRRELKLLLENALYEVDAPEDFHNVADHVVSLKPDLVLLDVNLPECCGFDVCIEAVGLPATFQACIDCAAFGGKVVLIGVGKQNLDFNFTLLQKKELNVYGSRNALKKDFLELIDLVKAGKVDLEKIITDVYPFEQAAQAFEDFSTKGGSMLKVGLDFTGIHG